MKTPKESSPPVQHQDIEIGKKAVAIANPLQSWAARSLEQRQNTWSDVLSLGADFLPSGWHKYLRLKHKRGSKQPKYGDGSLADEAVDIFIQQIQDTLSQVQYPTNHPHAGFNKHRDGYRYMARAHRLNPRSVEHALWNRFVEPQDAGLEAPTTQQRLLWRHFQVVMAEEGDTSALNVWDGQIVTLGAGFGGRYLQANRLMLRLPYEYLQKLYRVGIHFASDGTLYYLDTRSKRVRTGTDAWIGIKANPNLLAYWVELAQSTEELAGSENPSSPMRLRNWMLRAQFEQFYGNNAALLGTKFENAPFNVRMLLVKLHHWLSSFFSWDALQSCPTTFAGAMAWARKRLLASKFAHYAGQLQAMNRFAPLATEESIEEYLDHQYWNR